MAANPREGWYGPYLQLLFLIALTIGLLLLASWKHDHPDAWKWTRPESPASER